MQLIHLILEQYEHSTSWNACFEGNKTYSTKKGYPETLKRGSFVEQAKELEEAGLIKIKWINRGSDLEGFRYSFKSIPTFYEMVGRIPKYQKVKEIVNRATEARKEIHKIWIKRYIDDLIEIAQQGNIKKIPDSQEQIYQCLFLIDTLEEPIFLRIFSKKALHDSKLFKEKFESKIISIAKKFYSEVIVDSMSNKEILEQLFIDDYAQELSLKGSLRIKLTGNENWIDLSAFPYGIVLNAQTLRVVADIDGSKIRKVISIENKANYLSEPYQKNSLIVFSHGYYSPLEREFLKKLEKKLEDSTLYYHSGDLDYGGICIFQYIRKNIFPNLQPLNMNETIFREYLQGEMMEKMELETLEKLKKIKEPLLEELIQVILETKMQLEQEAFLCTVRNNKIDL